MKHPEQKFQTRYRYSEGPTEDFTVLDPKTGEYVPEKSRTKQSEAAECDVNNIVAKARQNGFMPPPTSEGQYGDFSDPMDYQAAMDLVLQAKEQFEELPAAVRSRFANDPKAFLQFATDPQNGDEMVKLGLAIPRPPATIPEPAQTPIPADPPEVPATKKTPKS